MKTLITILCLVGCVGCTELVPKVAAETPSLQYCSKVNYVRNGAEIEVSATCQAPIGGSLLH